MQQGHSHTKTRFLSKTQFFLSTLQFICLAWQIALLFQKTRLSNQLNLSGTQGLFYYIFLFPSTSPISTQKVFLCAAWSNNIQVRLRTRRSLCCLCPGNSWMFPLWCHWLPLIIIAVESKVQLMDPMGNAPENTQWTFNNGWWLDLIFVFWIWLLTLVRLLTRLLPPVIILQN